MSAREFIESREEMESILKEETIGYLGLCVDQKPYVVPLNYAYLDGRILFHCALKGKKLDYLKANPQVCFAVGRQFGPVRRHAEGNPCHVDSDSVICYGTGQVIEDPEERMAAMTAFNRCFKAGAEEISLEAAMKCTVVEISVSEMTGRWQRPDRKRTYRRFTFPE